jgi:adenylate cyclase
MPEAVKTEASFDFPFPPEAVWSIFSKTDWLNRAAGLPPVSYELTPRPEGGSRAIARARFFGMVPMQWEENAFEWVEPEYYQVERRMASGPVEKIFGGMEFKRSESGTRMRVFSEFTPRSSTGTILAKLVLAPMATSGMGAMAHHATEFLQGAKTVCFPKLPRTPVNEAAFTEGMRQLRTMVDDSSSLALLENFIRESADVEVARIQPFGVARKWKSDPWDVVRLFLQATRAGLLDLSWEVLCPNCRSSRQPLTTKLAEVSKSMHCDACQIRYDAEFDRSVELKFVVNSQVRRSDSQTFCLAGPGAKPHMLAQIVVPAGGERTLKLPTNLEGVRLKSPQVRDVLNLTEAPIDRTLIATADGFAFEKRDMAVEGLPLRNPNSYPVTITMERAAWSDDILTAARVTNFQEFRDLFSREVVCPTEQIVVGQQIILFTDLRGSTSMYCGIGDAPAYALVRDHFATLRGAIAEHHGAIVKTIGDAVMACFSNAGEALTAVRRMHLDLKETLNTPGRPVLRLKSSLHIGPCLAVNANDRLDYFGTTVNLAARLVDCCEGGDLTISDDFFMRSETKEFLREYGFSAVSMETRFRGFDSPTKVWRISITPNTVAREKES